MKLMGFPCPLVSLLTHLLRAGATTTLVLAGAVTVAHAQQAGWRPERPLELVVAVSAGGATDKTARLIQMIMQKHRIVDAPILRIAAIYKQFREALIDVGLVRE